jgi:uncharacterized MAPEG superfamily protein
MSLTPADKHWAQPTVARKYVLEHILNPRRVETIFQRENAMTTELTYLLYTTLLTGVLWIPVVIGYVTSRGLLKPIDYKVAPISALPDWVNRANRAHLNAVENFAPFAAVVLIAHVVGISNSVTLNAAAIFFYARAAHAVLHVFGVSWLMARTIIFTVAWCAFIAFALQLL